MATSAYIPPFHRSFVSDCSIIIMAKLPSMDHVADKPISWSSDRVFTVVGAHRVKIVMSWFNSKSNEFQSDKERIPNT